MDQQADRRARMRIAERFAMLGRKPGEPTARTQPDAARAVSHRLEDRVAHLESVVNALQDQLHRESQRRDQQIAELRHQIRPEELARGLSDDARRRGL